MTSMAMYLASNVWVIKELHPLIEKGWYRKKCPYITFDECLEDNEDK